MAEDRDALFKKFQKWFRADREFSAKWRKTAQEDFDFVAGEQWSAEDKAHLKSLMRPIITMNRTATIINAVSGQEMGNRQEVRYLPREQGDVKPNEILTEGARWFRDNADADDEDSEAFLHTTICGMGWTDTRIDHESDEEGMPEMSCPDPLKMFWDKSARAHNLIDRTRQWYVQAMPLSQAMEKFPDADWTELDAAWAKPDEGEGEAKDQERERLYEDDDTNSGGEVDDDKTVTIVHCEYLVSEKVYKVADMMSGMTSEMPEKQFRVYSKRAKELGIQFQSTEITRKKVKQAFLGRKILELGDGFGEHFRFQCVTGFKDHNKGHFYGLVRQMKDPQRWANKWLSQSLDILNSQAKGGVMMEEGAVENPKDFEKTWARTDKPTMLSRGALSNPNGPMVQPKPQAQFPAGFMKLLEYAVTAIRDSVGVSPEMMGMADRDQPASLEYQRRQSGMMILQPLFKNLKRYRHEHGRLMLYLIQNYLADGRLVKIVGEQGAQYVPLAKQADVKYDIVVDDAPTSPNQKEMVWSMIGEKFWELPPMIQTALLEFSPFPTTVIEKVKQASEQQSQGPMAQLQERLAKVEADLKEAQAQKAQAETQKTLSEIGQQENDPQAELEIERAKLMGTQAIQQQKLQGDQQIQQQKLQSEMALKVAELQFNQQIKSQESEAQIALSQQQAASQHSLARQQAQSQDSIARQQAASKDKLAMKTAATQAQIAKQKAAQKPRPTAR